MPERDGKKLASEGLGRGHDSKRENANQDASPSRAAGERALQGLVTGHDFSRAENTDPRDGASAPAPPSTLAALPPDHLQRSRALDPSQSFLVQAPAGSGKTYLLTQRFLRLLAQAERPDEIVAITFTKAAAAEMRNRILEALEHAESHPVPDANPESLTSLATAALNHARRMNWQLLDLPSQLRITTIDAFCRALALESPLSWGLLSGLGGKLEPTHSQVAHRTAARRTLALLEGENSPTLNAARESVEALLLWRDNNWQDIENLIVQMLTNRNRWFHDFVFDRDPDWPALRLRLEAAFQRAARHRLATLNRLLDHLPGCREYALELARLACANGGKSVPFNLAERAELPAEYEDEASLEDAIAAHRDLANFLLTAAGSWRKKGGLNVHHGFPATPQGRAGKEKFGDFLESLAEEPGLELALAAFQPPIPTRYEEPEWQLIRHCFAVLRTAAAQLQLVFAETGSVDFTEVAQIALRVLAPESGYASDFAQRQADSIRHLLVDEFQDTSRQQHELLARLIAAWPERPGRTCFCVGDPMQSIYGFRDAEVELFERLKTHGLETSSDQDYDPFPFEFIALQANFRTVPTLVEDLNQHFAQIFGEESEPGSVQFAPAIAARPSQSAAKTELHLAFTNPAATAPDPAAPESTQTAQLQEILALIQQKLAAARDQQLTRYRIAVLARTRKSLIPIAESLRQAQIPFRAIDLVKLNERPEVLDALTLARALLNPADRTAWLGVLRAPWCGLSLAELHLLTSADDPTIAATPIPVLLQNRLPTLTQLPPRAQAAATRVAQVLRQAQAERAATNSTLGTWLESIWKSLGGVATVDRAQAENLRVLWAALDTLDQGELDLLGPNLASALDDLYALPDPAASSEFGVQLLTIHKSKGLEFEVVVVPDLEARSKQTDHNLMSWLERGLAEPGPQGEITEFLIAPIKTKGGNASAAKEWVDRVKKHRDLLELRRLFYVAATRAREELHLFARPKFNSAKTGEAILAKPSGLLLTAWPAFAPQIEQQFAEWSSTRGTPNASAALESLAASANLLTMPANASPRPTLLRRLPAGYAAPKPTHPTSATTGAETPYARTEGGLRSRLLGTAIHAFLERLTHLRLTLTPAEAAQQLPAHLPAIAAHIRSGGLARTEAENLAAQALATALKAATDPIGAWIFAPHRQAETEAQWTSWKISHATQPRTLRPDRVFFAAPPTGEAEPVWWIIDYKTTHASRTSGANAAEQSAFLAEHRTRYAPQLEAYAQVLRSLHANHTLPIRVGIFYSQLLVFDHWAF
jgi:ATP-dependent exoDNAse (exonuclease V) beta subunit